MTVAQTHADAAAIYQHVLDIMSDATLAMDYDTICARMKLPFKTRTLSSLTIIETDDDLRSGITGMCQALAAQGVNQFIRLATGAEFLAPDYIEGHHVTHVLRNATPLSPSYANRSVLQRHEGIWKLIELDSALSNPAWPMMAVSPLSDDDASDLIASAADDIRRSATEPMALYQSFLDALTRTTLDNDFQGYCDLCSFPYTAHNDAIDEVVDGPQDNRDFFDMLMALMRDNQADRFERNADSAEFISGDMICGYHHSQFVRDGKVVIGPILSRMILRRTGTKWQLKSVTNNLSNPRATYTEPLLTDRLLTLREIQYRTGKWPTMH